MSNVLLDQNVPRPLAGLLTRHKVRSAADQGWDKFEDGHLLDAAEAAGFHCLVTSDSNIRFQQNLAKRRIALVVLSTNNWPRIRRNAIPIIVAVDAATPGSYKEVVIPW